MPSTDGNIEKNGISKANSSPIMTPKITTLEILTIFWLLFVLKILHLCFGPIASIELMYIVESVIKTVISTNYPWVTWWISARITTRYVHPCSGSHIAMIRVSKPGRMRWIFDDWIFWRFQKFAFGMRGRIMIPSRHFYLVNFQSFKGWITDWQSKQSQGYSRIPRFPGSPDNFVQF